MAPASAASSTVAQVSGEPIASDDAEPSTLLVEAQRLGLVLIAAGDTMRWRGRTAPPAHFTARLRSQRAALLEALLAAAARGYGGPDEQPVNVLTGADGWPRYACERCGGHELWRRPGRTTWQCTTCDPHEPGARVDRLVMPGESDAS